MAGSSIGKLFRLTTFGESHGEAIGGIIEGLPSNFEINLDQIQLELGRRAPGQSEIVTQRKEPDTLKILSGLYDGKTTGAPLGFIIENVNQKSQDYNKLQSNFRPSHADFTYFKKYGIRDPRGGGRSSARETACRVVAGAIAKQYLKHFGITFSTFVCQIGNIALSEWRDFTVEEIESTPVRCPNSDDANKMIEFIQTLKEQGDTVGGIVFSKVNGVPAGLGEPVFEKLNAELAKAIFSINAVKGLEFGSGFEGAKMLGSQQNDLFNSDGTTRSNNSGGIQGGISNGMPIELKVAFKPVSSIKKEQEILSDQGELISNQIEGRHDPCVVPRAVPIVESMVAIVVFDQLLQQKATNFSEFNV
jgi:chorismate synthase